MDYYVFTTANAFVCFITALSNIGHSKAAKTTIGCTENMGPNECIITRLWRKMTKLARFFRSNVKCSFFFYSYKKFCLLILFDGRYIHVVFFLSSSQQQSTVCIHCDWRVLNEIQNYLVLTIKCYNFYEVFPYLYIGVMKKFVCSKNIVNVDSN